MMNARMGLGTGAAARFAGAGALVLFLCWQHVQATRLGYQVESARRETLELRGRVAAMRVDLDERLSPEQVAARAARLGFVPASPDALRRLSEPRDAAPLGALTRLWARALVPLVAATRS
jgi:NAD(P)-dependent dehydrogenase (short-subunit alcohol dehydrogenase family)